MRRHWSYAGVVAILAVGVVLSGGHAPWQSAAALPLVLQSGDRQGLMRPLWTVRAGVNPFAVVVDARTGHVFVLNRGPANHKHSPFAFGPGSVAMLDAATGQVLHTAPAGDMPNLLLLDTRTERAFIFPRSIMLADGADIRTVLDTATGRVLYTRPFPQVLASAVSVHTGRVFVLGGVTEWVFDAASGRLLSQRPLVSLGLAVDARRRLVYVNAGPVGPCTAACIAVLDATTGAVRAAVPLNVQTNGVQVYIESLAVDERSGRIIADISYGGRGDASEVLIIDPVKKAIVHTLTMQGQTYSKVAVDDAAGHAFVVNTPSGYDATTNGGGLCRVNVIDIHSGRLVRETTVATSSGAIDAAVAIDARRGHAYVVSQPYGGPNPRNILYPYGNVPLGHGHLSVFDTRTGRLLRTITVGHGPQAVVLDAGTGRVYVSNGADGTLSAFDATRL